MGGGEIEKL
jgi:hypothetical protein